MRSFAKMLIVASLLSSSEFAFGLEFPPTKMTRDEAVTHLLNRAAFGPRPGDVERLRKPGELERWLEEQLEPAKIDDSKIEAKLVKLTFGNMSPSEIYAKFPMKATAESEAKRPDFMEKVVADLRFRKLALAAESRRQLAQVMTDFWFNHFTVDQTTTQMLAAYERDVVRANVFGKFSDMLIASARHPSMLYYLDNWRSSKKGVTTNPIGEKPPAGASLPTGVNENYGREVLELHTVGVHTQRDVENASLAFTGWTIWGENRVPAFKFAPTWHDESDVVVLGRTFEGNAGVDQALSLLRFLSSHERTASFISLKLCRRFETDPPTKACIDRLRETFEKTDGDLKQMYRTLFTSPEFWNPVVVAKKFKKPFEFEASSLRALDSNVEVTHNSVRLFNETNRRSGEMLYSCTTPAGYSDENARWMNASSILTRELEISNLIRIAKPESGKNERRMADLLIAPEFQKR